MRQKRCTQSMLEYDCFLCCLCCRLRLCGLFSRQRDSRDVPHSTIYRTSRGCSRVRTLVCCIRSGVDAAGPSLQFPAVDFHPCFSTCAIGRSALPTDTRTSALFVLYLESTPTFCRHRRKLDSRPRLYSVASRK